MSRISTYKSAVKRELKHQHQISYKESENWIYHHKEDFRQYLDKGYTTEQTAKVIMHRMRNANADA